MNGLRIPEDATARSGVSTFPDLTNYRVTPRDPLEQTLWRGDHAYLGLVRVPEGTEVPQEGHGADRVLTILSGTGLIRYPESDRMPVNPGDVVVIPAGVPCSIVNRGHLPLGFTTMVCPAGEGGAGAEATVRVTKAL